MISVTDLRRQNSYLQKHYSGLIKHREYLQNELTYIQSAKAYKLWQRIKHPSLFSIFSANYERPKIIYSPSVKNKYKNKQKIAVLSERLLTGFGVDLVVSQQARLLSSDYDITVFAITIDENFIAKAKFKVGSVAIPQHFNPIKQDINSLRYYFRFRKYFRKFDTFIIHTPTYHSWIPFLSRFAKTIVFYHGNSPSDSYTGLKKYRQLILNKLENNLYFPYANKIVSISQYLTTKLNKRNRNVAAVIQNAGSHILNESILNKPKIQKQILDFYGFNETDKYITYIGRLDYHNNPYKNTKLLMKLAKSIDAPTKYKVLGIGFPENNIQEELYENGVYTIANASSSELATLLAHSYIYCSPSLWEGFNLPLLEAQTLGIPVVAFDLPAHREIVVDGKTGFLVKTEEEYVDKCKLLLKDTNLRNSMSRAALEFSKSFTWENNVAKFSQLL